MGTLDVPILAGGDLFGWQSPDVLGWIEDKSWLFVSDLAGLLRGFTHNLSYLTLIALLLVPFTWWLLWRTVFGLRLRSCGENPTGADSLGVPVYRMRYAAVLISGALAGLAGAFLAIEAAGIYRQGQTGGRGFIGLAAMIFGNWMPFGAAAGRRPVRLRRRAAVAGTAGRARPPALRGAGRSSSTPGLLLKQGQRTQAAVIAVLGVLIGLWYFTTDKVQPEFVQATPYVITLLVLSIASQRLRPPAAEGQALAQGPGGVSGDPERRLGGAARGGADGGRAAYAPYSGLRVGAAALTDDGPWSRAATSRTPPTG